MGRKKKEIINDKEIARRLIENGCGRPTDIVLSVENARYFYFEVNKDATEEDFQEWLESIPEETNEKE